MRCVTARGIYKRDFYRAPTSLDSRGCCVEPINLYAILRAHGMDLWWWLSMHRDDSQLAIRYNPIYRDCSRPSFCPVENFVPPVSLPTLVPRSSATVYAAVSLDRRELSNVYSIGVCYRFQVALQDDASTLPFRRSMSGARADRVIAA